MTLKASTSGAFVKGLDVSTGLLLQPKGSVPRASNLLLTKRGSLRTCDGSYAVAAWTGVPTPGRGKALCDFLFSPIAVAPYILRIMEILDLPLGAPQHLTVADGGTGGTLSGTFFYVVTAIDGAGGMTLVSNEVSITVAASHKTTVTWNLVPNAVGYQVWRGTTPGAEGIIVAPQPVLSFVPQPSPPTATVTFTDTGYPTQISQRPGADTTTQTGLFAIPINLPGATVAYSYANLVALWPAAFPSPSAMRLNAGFGNISLIPQIVQFVNEAIIALGNAYPPQIYSDPTSPDNMADSATITGITVDAFGVVTVSLSANHDLVPGSNVLIQNVNPSLFNGTFPVITTPTLTSFTIRNLAAVGHAYISGGKIIGTTVPIQSTFMAEFPTWAAKTSFALNSIVEPTTSPTNYFQAIAPGAGGLSGATEPAWPTSGGADGHGLGLTVQDGNITWQNAGLIASAAPPPPGAAHLTVYAGALWVFDTASTNTVNGLDGPCCLRMSDVNNPNSWNPVNTAFLDKDDGTEGEGLVTFTITAQGIPPEGSLVAAKLYALYQIVGVFGSANFAIQRVVTDMGCTSPRTMQFVPGYGIGRNAHLGIAVFDGVADRLISPQVVPYLFSTTDPELSDITPIDPAWTLVACSALTSNPTMYCVFIPVGPNSVGALTRALCFDLVLKAWTVVNLPFPVSTSLQAKGVSFQATTMFGSYNDGTLQKWQDSDLNWETYDTRGHFSLGPVAWSLRTQTTASKDPEERLYCRRAIVIGQVGQGIISPITIQPRANGVARTAQLISVPASGRFAVQAGVGHTSDLFDAIISGSGDITIDACSFDVSPKPIGTLVGLIG